MKINNLKQALIIFIALSFSNTLSANFTLNDYINGSINYNSNAEEFGNNNIADLRLDNRLVTTYETSFFKAEAHLLTSVSNFKNSSFQIPVDLVIENDKYSLFNLTKTTSNNNSTIINRIDRLNFSIFGSNYNFNIGRDTVTWSRGRTFHVTDFFNPQIPGFYDGAYKLGTDLVSFNYSSSQNHNFSFVFNPKRNHITKALTMKDSNMGFRYLYSDDKIDTSFIIGQYVRDFVVATGFSSNFLFSSVLRGDFALYKPDEDKSSNVFATTISVEKSLLIKDKFTNIFAEYYYNGFGNNNIDITNPYSSLSPTLIRRLEEQDTYLLSKSYLSLGFNVEFSTYLYINYSNIVSLKDGSMFHFLGASYNYSDKTDISLSIGLPFGYKNEEFGEMCQDPNNCIQMGALVLFGLSYAI